MFGKLLDFAYERNWKEAAGFYLAYFAFFFLGSMVISVALAILFSDSDASALGTAVGSMIALLSSPGLSFLILFKKGRLNHFGFLLIGLLSGVLGIYGGVLGLIPVAFLTTRKAKSNKAVPDTQE